MAHKMARWTLGISSSRRKENKEIRSGDSALGTTEL